MNNISRRDFIKAVGIGAAIITVPGTGLGFKLKDSQKPEIGIQLYTVRNEIEKDFERTIRRIAGMGFKGVETYFFPENISLAYGAEVIKKYGLKILGSHCELPVGKERKTILKMA